jgi:excisionase family DNA binding protein
VHRQNPYEFLADALAGVVREAVKDALGEVTISTTSTPAMVSVSEAAGRLGLGKTKLNELIASGELPSVVVGKRRLLRPADLEAFAARCRNGQ